MMTRELIEQARNLLALALVDADAEIVAAVRRNDGREGSRESLLAQLDVLEKVGERLHVRFDNLTSAAASAGR